VSGGATSPPPSPPPAAAPEPQVSPLQAQLADGIRLFDLGEFYAAAGRLRNLPNLKSAPVDTQTTALKYLAFSYCVTNRRTLCQEQFEAALKLDPKFDLAPAERGHPIWKVVFERAKASQPKAAPAKGAEPKAAPRPDEVKTQAAAPPPVPTPPSPLPPLPPAPTAKGQAGGPQPAKAQDPPKQAPKGQTPSATNAKSSSAKAQSSSAKSQKGASKKGQADARATQPEPPPMTPQ